MKETKSSDVGILAAVRDFLREPMPEGVGWTHVFGSILLFLVLLQVVTGILLALVYSPSPDAAYESVQYIDNHVLFGRFVRGLHHWSASAFVVVLVLHLLRTFVYAAYKSPRRGTWVAGVALFLVVLGFAFTGYLLPWDMKAYFATRVGIEVGASAPGLGPMVATLLQGGSELGELTLTRFYALHVVILPLLLLALVGVHLYFVRRFKITPPWKRNDEPVRYSGSFYPRQFARDQVAVTLVFLILAFLAYKLGAPLEARADPTDTNYVPRPDWYFYGLYQLLRLFQGPLEVVGTVVIPTLFFVALFALPFVDRSPERALARRRGLVATGLGTFGLILLLTVWGGIEGAREVEAARQRAAELTRVAPPDVETANPERGAELFDTLRCGGCHGVMSQGVNIPPGLEFAGSKFQESWLTRYLQEPYRIRWADTNVRPLERMPDFQLTEAEARDLAAYVMQNVNPTRIPPTGIDWSQSDSAAVAEGRKLVEQYACTGCHVIGEEGTNLGPNLNRVGSKLQPDYIYHLILRPRDVIPDTPMKDNQLWEEEAVAMVRYLLTLR